MKILLVDDSGTMRKIQRNVLDSMGYKDVVEAEDGEQAIFRMKEHNFQIDLILCDWNMPKMDGITLVRKLNAVPNLARIPILMVTTEGEKEKVVEALKAGAKGYVIKPFTPDQLKKRIEETLQRQGS